jgi:hypothetical protein
MTNRIGAMGALACIATLTVVACSSSSASTSGGTDGGGGSTSSSSGGTEAGTGDAGSHLGQACNASPDCKDTKLACPRDPNPLNSGPPEKCSKICRISVECPVGVYCCKKDAWTDHVCVGSDLAPDKSFCDIP